MAGPEIQPEDAITKNDEDLTNLESNDFKIDKKDEKNLKKVIDDPMARNSFVMHMYELGTIPDLESIVSEYTEQNEWEEKDDASFDTNITKINSTNTEEGNNTNIEDEEQSEENEKSKINKNVESEVKNTEKEIESTTLSKFLEDINEETDNLKEKAIELFEQNTDIRETLEEKHLSNEKLKTLIQKYLNTNEDFRIYIKIAEKDSKYPKNLKYLGVIVNDGREYTVVPWPQEQINVMIIDHIIKDANWYPQFLAEHLKSMQGDLSNRWKNPAEQVKNIQQTLHVHLEDQDRAKAYLAHIDNKQARTDNLNNPSLTDDQKSILESYNIIYDNLTKEIKPEERTETKEGQVKNLLEKLWDFIVQGADLLFRGKDWLFAKLEGRWLKFPRVTDRVNEQYQKEFAFSTEQQETFTAILEWLPQDWTDNPFTKPFNTSKEAIDSFFESTTQTDYLNATKDQYENFSPKAVQKLITLYNKGNPNNTVEIKDFIKLNGKNEPTEINIDSRDKFTTILNSETTQNLITQADQQINWYQKVGENYIYNMNPENFWSATNKNINTAKDVAQYMTAFLVAWDKDFKYVITENSLIDTNDQKEAQENPEEEFTKNIEELTKNMDDTTINKAEGYKYSNDNVTDYQAKILQPISQLFSKDNYDLLVEEIKKDPSPIKERLQKSENFKNLFLFDNTLTNITKDQNSTRNTLVGLTSTSISIDNDNNIIADSWNTAIGKFKLNPTDDTNKKIITKIEDTNA